MLLIELFDNRDVAGNRFLVDDLSDINIQEYLSSNQSVKISIIDKHESLTEPFFFASETEEERLSRIMDDYE